MTGSPDINVTTLDVRPILAEGEEPFDAIMAALASLTRDTSLELIAPFEPTPLYEVLEERGFAHETARGKEGEWVVTIRMA
ncbi:MAG: DUF2249 domain-containing protein [Gemmatimonadales bacterium]